MRGYPERGLHGQVVRDIGSRIVHGDLGAGSTLDPEFIGEQFGVSRTVVREAFKVLGAKGLLDARPKRGTVVVDREQWNLLDPDVLRWQYDRLGGPTAQMLDQLAEVRAIVEPAGAALAAARRTARDLDELDAALDHLVHAGNDVDAITTADVRFHCLLLHATHNELLLQMEMVIDAGLHARTKYVHLHDPAARPSQRAHAAVLDAVRAADPERARAEMLQLLDNAAKDVSRVRRRVQRLSRR